MQENSLITFILFGYNQAHFVKEAIDGAFAQTYSPLEIILSDDCSGDDTFAIMTEMAANYRGPHKIILNRNEQNRGVGAHVNRAFGMATGEWIVTAACDDISDPGRCARVMELARRYPDAGAIGLGWRDIDENGNVQDSLILSRYAQSRIDAADNTGWIGHFQSGDFGLWGMSAAWKRDLIELCPPLDNNVVQEDEIFTFWSLFHGMNVVHDSKPFVSYRHHGSNACGYDAATDLETREKRRTRRAAMEVVTWSFLRKHLENDMHRHIPPVTKSSLSRLAGILKIKETVALIESQWWNMGVMERFFNKVKLPGRGRFLKRPQEWLRLLPYPLYLRFLSHS